MSIELSGCDSMRDKNILIFGGAGFIGSNLADKLLTANNNVIVVDNFDDYYSPELKRRNVKHNLDNPNYKLITADIEDDETTEKILAENKVDCVVHLAAKAGVRPSIKSPIAYAKTNIIGTLNILNAMNKANVQKIVFASSSSVYGDCDSDWFKESFNASFPISPYAATKKSCEEFLYTYHKTFGLDTVILRFFSVYGPRQRPDLAIRKFIDNISTNTPITVFGDGTTARDYTFVDDITDGIIAAIEYNKSSFEIINLSSGHPICLNDMIATIEDILGKKAIIERLSLQTGDVTKTAGDISKANKLLEYTPKIDFKTGIKLFVEWQKNNDSNNN